MFSYFSWLKPLENMVKSPWITIPPRSARCLPTDFPVNWTNAPTTSAECGFLRQKKTWDSPCQHGQHLPGFWNPEPSGCLSKSCRDLVLLVTSAGHRAAQSMAFPEISSTMVFTTRREMWLETTNYPLVIINGHLELIYPLKIVMFHSYVSLPEGVPETEMPLMSLQLVAKRHLPQALPVCPPGSSFPQVEAKQSENHRRMLVFSKVAIQIPFPLQDKS